MFNFANATPHGDYIHFGNIAVMDAPVAYSYAVWLNKTASADGVGTFFGKRPDDSSGGYWNIYTDNVDKINVQHYDGTATIVTANTALTVGTTQHIGGTWDGANMDFYLNGVPDGTPAFTRAITTNSVAVTIGDIIRTGSLGLQCKIGQVMWWNVALTAAEMASVYAGFIPRVDRLKFWPECIYDPGFDRIGGIAGTKVGTVSIALDDYKTWFRPSNLGLGGHLYTGEAVIPTPDEDIGDISVMEIDAPGYAPTGKVFGGAADYYSLSSDLTDNLDGKDGTISFRIRFDGTDGVNHTILHGYNGAQRRVSLTKDVNNKIKIILRNVATGAIILNYSTVTTYTTGVEWHNVILSWSLGITTAYLYVDDVLEGTPSVVVDDTIDYTLATIWTVGAKSTPDQYVDGAISELWADFTSYMNLPVEANRRKFFDKYGNPVPKGDDGSRPTGLRPILYFPKGDGSDNKGYGGIFTENGAPTDITVPVDHTRYLSESGVPAQSIAQYHGKVLSWSPVRRGISEHDATLTRPEVNVTIDDNDKDFAHLIESEYGHQLRRSATRLKLLGSGLTSFTYFTGLLTSWSQNSPHRYNLILRQDDEALERKFPKARITQYDWPDVHSDTLGKFATILYGSHDSTADTNEGMLPTLYVDTSGFRYIVSYGWAKEVKRVYVDGVETDSSNYAITHPVINGRQWTLVDFTSDQSSAIITVDADGYEENGNGTGSLIVNPVRQWAHVLENFIYTDYLSGSWSTGNAPLEDSLVGVAANFADRGAFEGAIRISGDQIKGKDFVNAWLKSWEARAFWTRLGELAVLFLDSYPQSLYKDNEITYSWLRWHKHEQSYTDRLNVEGIANRIVVRYTMNSVSGSLKLSLEMKDPSVVEEMALSLDQIYGAGKIV